MKPNRSEETYHHLLNWTTGAASALRLAAQILLDQGFTLVTHQLGGPDRGADAVCLRDGERWIMSAYFPPKKQKQPVIIKKFVADLAALAINAAIGIVFITNQELSLAMRAKMKALAGANLLEIFHLERLASILEQPHMAMIRQQFVFDASEDDTEQEKRAALLAATQRDVTRLEGLAAQDLLANGPLLADQLNNLAVFLGEAGQPATALIAIKRAVVILEELAEKDFAPYAGGLAMVLSNLSSYLANTGDVVAATVAIKRAVVIREKLAEQNFAAHAPGLANSLNNLSNCLALQGEQIAALAAMKRAVPICEALVEQDFSAHAPDLAMTLSNLSICLANQAQHVAALEAIRRASAIYEQLVAKDAAAHAPGLAQALTNLSNRLADQGEQQEALAVAKRAVTILEGLAKQNFVRHGAILANGLNSLSEHLAGLGERADALDAIQRAVAINEELVAEDFAAHGAQLAGSLHNLSVQLASGGGDFALPISISQRAVAIYERLAEQNFAVFGPALGQVIISLTKIQAAQKNDIATLATAKRAVVVFEKLTRQNADAHQPDLAKSLHNLGICLYEQGEALAAQTAMRQAIALRESLEAKSPTKFAPELAFSLFILFSHTEDPGASIALLARAIKLIAPNANTDEHRQWHENMQASLRERIAGATKTIALACLELRNYRGFSQFKLDFDPRLTVLVGENGHGKTTILDACRMALWSFVSAFDLARAKADWQRGIAIDDVHIHQMPDSDFARQLPVQIAMTGHVGVAARCQWSQVRDSAADDGETKDDEGAKWLRMWSNLLQEQTRIPNQPVLDLPVFAYYGVDRLGLRQDPPPDQAARNQDRPENDQYIRTFAYRDCLDSAASYQQFVAWFKWVSEAYNETRIKNADQGLPSDTPSVWLDRIRMVRLVVDCLLKDATGWHSLEYSVSHEKSLILRKAENQIMKVGQLSDGIRNILGMVGDLAHRCIRLNPQLGARAVEEACGVVLIDEIDMHLHPDWQQRIIDQLQAAFPRIQFIVTTHSPQVLSTVLARQIRDLHHGKSDTMVDPVRQETRGIASSDVLARILRVHPVPDVPEAKQLQRYRELIQQNLHESDEGLRLLRDLNAHFGADHPEMQDCTRMIGLEEFKRKVAIKRTQAKQTAGDGNA